MKVVGIIGDLKGKHLNLHLYHFQRWFIYINMECWHTLHFKSLFFSPLLCSHHFSLFPSPLYSFPAAGHVFNMPHDNVKACEEVFGKLQDNHMMSPTLIRINRTSPWSQCSAAIITDYLDSGHGKSKKVKRSRSRLWIWESAHEFLSKLSWPEYGLLVTWITNATVCALFA